MSRVGHIFVKIVGNYQVRYFGDLKWYKVHKRFVKIGQGVQKLKQKKTHARTHAHTEYGDCINLFLFLFLPFCQ